MRLLVLCLLLQPFLVGCLSITSVVAEYQAERTAEQWSREYEMLCRSVMEGNASDVEMALDNWQVKAPKLLKRWSDVLEHFQDARARQRQVREYRRALAFNEQLNSSEPSYRQLCRATTARSAY